MILRFWTNLARRPDPAVACPDLYSYHSKHAIKVVTVKVKLDITLLFMDSRVKNDFNIRATHSMCYQKLRSELYSIYKKNAWNDDKKMIQNQKVVFMWSDELFTYERMNEWTE